MSNPQEPRSPDPGDSLPPYDQPTPPPPPPPPPSYMPSPPQYGQQQPPPYGQSQSGQQWGQQPQYGQQPYGGYPARVGTNGFAIASLICAFLCSPLGIVFGFIAKSQIKQNGEGGDGLATAGIIISIVFIVIPIIVFAVASASFSSSTGP